jgi:hypothetical protein
VRRAVKTLEMTERRMTPAQVSEAQQLPRDWSQLRSQLLIKGVCSTARPLTSTCAFAHTVGHGSTVTAHPMYRDAAPSVALYGNRDVWGHCGTY